MLLNIIEWAIEPYTMGIVPCGGLMTDRPRTTPFLSEREFQDLDPTSERGLVDIRYRG